MPHLVIQYTANIEPQADMGALCRRLADTLIAQRGEGGKRIFPIGGTRVLAYPAAHFAVADDSAGTAERAFVYLNLRIAPGRAAGEVQAAGNALLAATQAHFVALFATRLIGITLQIDEGAAAFDAKHSNLHPLFYL